MKNVLVLGGTRFFGKRLVERLIDAGVSVTIATRGRTPDPFGNSVRRMLLDRTDRESILEALPLRGEWDVVFDQICYSPAEAELACEVFADRVGRYVLTSTQSVYERPGRQAETDFEPRMLPIRRGARGAFSYSEGKRFAEAVFFQKARFPVAAIRFPIVLGNDDYTGRLEFHIDRVRESRTILVPSLAAKTSFIHSSEAARFLHWAADQPFLGILNASSLGEVAVRQVLAMIEEKVGGKAMVEERSPEPGEEGEATPFTGPDSRLLDVSRAQALGFRFSDVMDWLPRLVWSRSCNLSAPAPY